MRKKFKTFLVNVLFMLVVLIVLLIFFEIILRITYPSWANFNSEMWRYSTEIKKISDIPNVSHVHQPNKSSILYGVEIKTNSLGFRDKEYSREKSRNTTRILVLGDSVTLGWGVNQTDIYTEVLEKDLNRRTSQKFEVLNAAVGNYNTEMESYVLKEYSHLGINALIIGFFPNDGEKTNILHDSITHRLKKNLYLYPFFWDKYTKLRYSFKTFDNNNHTSFVHQFYTEQYGGKKRIAESFSRIADLASAYEFKVYVVIIPLFYSDFSSYDAEYIHDFVLRQCELNGFICVNSLDKLKEYDVEDIIISKEDAHPNALGHRLIAESIGEVIEDV